MDVMENEAGCIRLLDEHTINQIAAGEVVENSAAALKELVENSIDAGASKITIDLSQGGRSLLRVTDNGRGMTLPELHLALQRHATSKIRSIGDLSHVLSMGFRGEALPSIAAISRLRITSATEDGQGWSLLFEGGRLIEETKAARAQGTTVEVRDLFFNVPARLKFQKSVAADAAHCLKSVRYLSLVHPTVAFQCTSYGKVDLDLQAVTASPQGLMQRSKEIFGDHWDKADAIALDEGPLKITLILVPPAVNRPSRTEQIIAINSRIVIHQGLSAAVREAIGPQLDQGRHPLFVMSLKCPAEWVDVNVHPQKREVRLHKEATLRACAYRATGHLLQRLLHHEEILPVAVTTELSAQPPVSEHSDAPSIWSAWEERSQKRLIDDLDYDLPQLKLAPAPAPVVISQPLLQTLPAKILANVGAVLLVERQEEGFWAAAPDQLWLVHVHALQSAELSYRMQQAATVQAQETLLIPAHLQAEVTEEGAQLLQKWGFTATVAKPGVLLAVPIGMSCGDATYCAELLLQEQGASKQFWCRWQGRQQPRGYNTLLERLATFQWQKSPMGESIRKVCNVTWLGDKLWSCTESQEV